MHATKFGQSLCVLGSIPELGEWKYFKHHMQWTEGNVWISKEPLMTSSYYFSYKYATLDENCSQLIGWERGVDRIADLEVMPDYRSTGGVGNLNSQDLMYQSANQILSQKRGDFTMKQCHYNDEYESYQISFMVSHPKEDMSDEMIFSGSSGGTKNITM